MADQGGGSAGDEPPERAARGTRLGPAFLIFSAVLALYLALPCRQYNFDGLVFSIFIRHSLYLGLHPDLLHNEHILYGPIGYAFCWPLVRLGLAPDVRAILSLLGSVAGAAAGAALYRALKRLPLADRLAAPLAFTMSLSTAFWLFSTDAEVYIFTALTLLSGAPLCLRLLRDEATPRERVASGLLPGLALGFHLANVLFLPAFVYCHLARGARRSLRALGGALTVAAGAILLPFLAKFVLFPQDNGILEGFLAVFTRRSDADTSYWGLPDLRLEASALLGAFVDPRPGLQGAVPFLIRTALVMAIASALLMLPRLLRRERSLVIWLGLWMLPYYLFFSVWNAGDTEFTLFQIPPLLLFFGLAAGAVAPEARGASRLLAPCAWTLILLLGAQNTLSTFIPLADEGRNRDLAVADYVREKTGPGDLVVIGGRGEETNLKAYLPYYSGRETMILDFWFSHLQFPNDEAERRVLARLRQVTERGGTVYVSSPLLRNRGIQGDFETLHHLPAGYLGRLFSTLGPEPSSAGPDGFALFRLTALPGQASSRLPAGPEGWRDRQEPWPRTTRP